jgi:putative SOS response-associated peptidase YedK
MCVNFRSARTAEIEAIIADDIQGDIYPSREVWPGYTAALVRRDKGTGKRVAEPAIFGMIPHWSRDTKIVRSTYNARSETVAEKASFKTAWKNARFCLIPMEQYYEPNWETGKAVRWSLKRKGVESFCVAGIYSWWKGEGHLDGIASFSLLTVNADGDPLLKRFHGPDDEKRSIVHITPDEYDAWLDASPELARAMLQVPNDDDLEVAPSPAPLRTPKAKPKSSSPLLD